MADVLINVLSYSYEKRKLSVSQRRGVKLIPKTDRKALDYLGQLSKKLVTVNALILRLQDCY